MLAERDILGIVSNELSQSESYTDWETSLNYYLGNPDGKEIDGRSAVVSTDVADAIEWIMPQVMKSFTQNNEVVVFDPLGPQDEQQADIESKYVYDVLMKENDGFIILHQFVKDALLQNNGIIKVYYEEQVETTTQAFSGLSQEQVVACTQSPNVEVLEYGQDTLTGTFAIKISIKTTDGKISLESIPPEQFRYSANHNSINLDTCPFTAHVVRKTVSDLIKEGFDPDLLADIGDNSGYNESSYRFNLQGENFVDSHESDDPALRTLDIAECFMQIDLNEDGVAEYCKITVAGYNSPTHILSIEELDYSPWISTTGILMSHKFRGLSIFDRLRQIQDQKTALLRNMLDNIYLQNNQRNVIVEGQVNMDDMLVSRPGGIIRAKRLDAISPLITPQLGQDAYNMLQYLDGVRAGRVGVAPEGEVTPQRIGHRVGSEGVAQLLHAKEELVGLIVRVIAETGIKPLCTKIRDLCIRHVNAVQNYKYRGEWVPVQPSLWPNRNRTTVRVGTGTGNHDKQQAALQSIISIQAQIQQIPGQTLVNPQKVYAALDDVCKYSELNGAAKYFLDPSSPEGQQTAQSAAQQSQQAAMEQKQQDLAMMQSQMQIAEAQVKIAQAQQDNVVLKAQIEQLKNQLETAKAAANAASEDADRLLKRYEVDQRTAVALTQIEAQNRAQQNKNYIENLKILKDSEEITEEITKERAEENNNEERDAA